MHPCAPLKHRMQQRHVGYKQRREGTRRPLQGARPDMGKRHMLGLLSVAPRPRPLPPLRPAAPPAQHAQQQQPRPLLPPALWTACGEHSRGMLGTLSKLALPPSTDPRAISTAAGALQGLLHLIMHSMQSARTCRRTAPAAGPPRLPWVQPPAPAARARQLGPSSAVRRCIII